MTIIATFVFFAATGLLARVWVIWLHVLAVSSALHNLLPPWDWDAAFLSDFPKGQALVRRLLHNRWYKLFVMLVGIIALNGRSVAWPSIAMPKQFEKLQNGGSQQ